MKTTTPIFLLSITFLIFFFSSSASFADDLQDAAEAVRNKEYEESIQVGAAIGTAGESDCPV